MIPEIRGEQNSFDFDLSTLSTEELNSKDYSEISSSSVQSTEEADEEDGEFVYSMDMADTDEEANHQTPISSSECIASEEAELSMTRGLNFGKINSTRL